MFILDEAYPRRWREGRTRTNLLFITTKLIAIRLDIIIVILICERGGTPREQINLLLVNYCCYF